MQKVPSDVLSFSKAQGFDLASYVMEWEGFSVYALEHDTDGELCYTGYPIYALVDNQGNIREALYEEMMAILSA